MAHAVRDGGGATSMSYSGPGQFDRITAGSISYTDSGLGLTRENTAANDPDAIARQWAVDGLVKHEDPAAVEPLLDFLRDEKPYVRRWAAKHLVSLANPLTLEPLRQLGDGTRVPATPCARPPPTT